MDFLYKKHPKGSYEHLSYKRKMDIIITVFLFALSLGIYITGYVTTGSKKNLLTIVAVLGLLPASKMVVEIIMDFRAYSCDLTTKAHIDNNIGSLNGLYNMCFTAYEKNFGFSHMVVTSNSVIGYSSQGSINEKEFQTHLNNLLRKEGIKDILIKVFTDEEKYINRLKELNKLEDRETNLNVLGLIMNVTL